MGFFSRKRPVPPETQAARPVLYATGRPVPQHVLNAMQKHVVPQLVEFGGNSLNSRYDTYRSGDLRVRLAGNELLTGMLLDCYDPSTYSTFVSLFQEASVGGPSPERDQLELLQYPRFTLRRQAAPDLTADREANESRLKPLLIASAHNLGAVFSIAVHHNVMFRTVLKEHAPDNWLATYGLAVISDLRERTWEYPGPLPPRL